MILYIDGSSTKVKNTHKRLIAYGLVALDGDEHIEEFGSVEVPGEFFGQCHEYMALVEAAKFVHKNNIKPETVSIYSDDEPSCYAGGLFHRHNYKATDAKEFLETLWGFCRKVYDEEIFRITVDLVVESRFTKVKGHARTVNNLRADYLAKYARTKEDFKEYDDWLNDGFMKYGSDDRTYKWYPPFTGSLDH
jgi:ribonuclease HI